MQEQGKHLPEPGQAQTFDLVPRQLLEALRHPIRSTALSLCHLRPTSATEVAEEMGIETNKADYHMKKLLALDCIEVVKEKRRGVNTETFYRATVRHYFDTETWAAVPKEERLGPTMGILGLVSEDVSKAIVGGTLVTKDDDHLSRTPLKLDQEGWDNVVVILQEALDRVWAERGDAAERLLESEAEPIYASVSIMHFELPAPS